MKDFYCDHHLEEVPKRYWSYFINDLLHNAIKNISLKYGMIYVNDNGPLWMLEID